MMTITMTPVEVTTFLQSRRGSKVFRRVTILPNIREIDYNALPGCALELVDAQGHVWARFDISQNRGGVRLEYLGPPADGVVQEVEVPTDMKLEAKATVTVEKGNVSQSYNLKKKEKEVAKSLEEQREEKDDSHPEGKTEEKEDAEPSEEKVAAQAVRVAKILAAHNAAQILYDRDKANERNTAPKVDSRLEKKDDDSVQQVGGKRSDDGHSL